MLGNTAGHAIYLPSAREGGSHSTLHSREFPTHFHENLLIEHADGGSRGWLTSNTVRGRQCWKIRDHRVIYYNTRQEPPLRDPSWIDRRGCGRVRPPSSPHRLSPTGHMRGEKPPTLCSNERPDSSLKHTQTHATNTKNARSGWETSPHANPSEGWVRPTERDGVGTYLSR